MDIQQSFYDLIRFPIYTEKSNILMENGKYTFKVLDSANKYKIKHAIESIFKVDVKSVRIINVSGSLRRFKNNLGRTAKSKKALITLENGQKIDYNLLQLKGA